MHDQVVGGNVEPFQQLDQLRQPRVPRDESFVHEPDRVVVIHVVAEVLVADVLEGAVGGAADPVQEPAEPRIGVVAAEHGVVAALVDQVGADRHRVAQQQHGAGVDPRIAAEQSGEAQRVAADPIQQGAAVVPEALRFVECAVYRDHRRIIRGGDRG
jgi:hypothetical protein